VLALCTFDFCNMVLRHGHYSTVLSRFVK
jgi:hypothetical protein